MNVPLVMTVIGPDRPGLVEALAGIVARHGGNWLESRMAHLGGHFAGILHIHLPEAEQAPLTESLRKLASHGLTIVAHPALSEPPAADHSVAAIEIIAHDRPGIVRQISEVLARHGVNVEELSTECRSAPMTGELLFDAKATLRIPPSCDPKALRSDLEKIAQELMADIKLAGLP